MYPLLERDHLSIPYAGLCAVWGMLMFAFSPMVAPPKAAKVADDSALFGGSDKGSRGARCAGSVRVTGWHVRRWEGRQAGSCGMQHGTVPSSPGETAFSTASLYCDCVHLHRRSSRDMDLPEEAFPPHTLKHTPTNNTPGLHDPSSCRRGSRDMDLFEGPGPRQGWRPPSTTMAGMLFVAASICLHTAFEHIEPPEHLPWLWDRAFISLAFVGLAALAVYLQVGRCGFVALGPRERDGRGECLRVWLCWPCALTNRALDHPHMHALPPLLAGGSVGCKRVAQHGCPQPSCPSGGDREKEGMSSGWARTVC